MTHLCSPHKPVSHLSSSSNYTFVEDRMLSQASIDLLFDPYDDAMDVGEIYH